MLYTFTELQKKGFNHYKIKKLVETRKLYKLEAGLYSDSLKFSRLEMLLKQHDNIIFTLESALYFYGMIKDMPPYYTVATVQKARKIKEVDVKQTFMTDNLFHIGSSKITREGQVIPIYDVERLLIEVVRNKTNIDYDIYKEAIESFVKVKKLLNLSKIQKYMESFSNPKIRMRIKREIFSK